MSRPQWLHSCATATWLCCLVACCAAPACTDGAGGGGSADGSTGSLDAGGPDLDAKGDVGGAGPGCPAGTPGCACAPGGVCFAGACEDGVCSGTPGDGPDAVDTGGSDTDLPPGDACTASADCEPGQYCIRRTSGTHECGALPACVILSGMGLKAWSPEDQDCTQCPPCDEEGTTGAIWPTTNQNGNCICETIDGYFFDDASDELAPAPCDEDGDGWVRDVARGYLSSSDVGLRENARCSVLTVGGFRLVNERGESRDVAVDEVVSPNKTLELFEAAAIDRDDETTGGAAGDKLPTYAGRAFHAAELNGLTKACAGLTADYNQNGVSDIEESWSSQPEHEWQLGLLRMSYFIELHASHYEDADGAGRLVIAERPRCGAGFPLTYGKGSDAYLTCTRVRPYTYDSQSEAPGFDYARWACDATSGSCPPPSASALAQSDGDPSAPDPHPYCVDPPSLEPGAWTGMNHHSQFQCVSFVTNAEGGSLEPYERAANATDKTYAKNVCYLSADDAPEIACNAETGANIEPGVGWSLALYSDETPGCSGESCFARGCIPECPSYEALCPGFSTGTAGCSSDGKDGSLICNKCPETGKPCGAGQKGACASATWYCVTDDDGNETPICGYEPSAGADWRPVSAANDFGDPPFGEDEDCDGFHGDLEVSWFVSAKPDYHPEPPWGWTMDSPGPADQLQQGIIVQAHASYPTVESGALQAPRRRYLYLGKGTLADVPLPPSFSWANVQGTLTIIGGQDEGEMGDWVDDPTGRTTLEGSGANGLLRVRLSRGSVELKKLDIVSTVAPPPAGTTPQNGEGNTALLVMEGMGTSCTGDLTDADLLAQLCGGSSPCCAESWDSDSDDCWAAAKSYGWCPTLTVEDCTITVEGGGDAWGMGYAVDPASGGDDGLPGSPPCSPGGCGGFGCQALASWLTPEIMTDELQCAQYCAQKACYKGIISPFDSYGLGGVGCDGNDGGDSQTELMQWWLPKIGHPGDGNDPTSTSNEGDLGQPGGNGDSGMNGAAATKWDELHFDAQGITFAHKSSALPGSRGGGGGGGGQGGYGVLTVENMCPLGPGGSISVGVCDNALDAWGYVLHGGVGGGGGGGGCGGSQAPSAGSGGAAVGIHSDTRAIALTNTTIDVSDGGGDGGDAIVGGTPGPGGKGGLGFDGFSASNEAKFEYLPTTSGTGGDGGWGGWGGHGMPGLGGPAVCVTLFEETDGGAWDLFGEGASCAKGKAGEDGSPVTTCPQLPGPFAPACNAVDLQPAPKTATKLSESAVIRGAGATLFEPK